MPEPGRCGAEPSAGNAHTAHAFRRRLPGQFDATATFSDRKCYIVVDTCEDAYLRDMSDTTKPDM